MFHPNSRLLKNLLSKDQLKPTWSDSILHLRVGDENDQMTADLLTDLAHHHRGEFIDPDLKLPRLH